MWHISRDEIYLFDVDVILQVVSFYRDEPELDTLFLKMMETI
jgi:hypothetical protein